MHQKNNETFLSALQDREPVGSSTHAFYKYPARFSPKFVRAAIEHFTSSGQLVIDPFMGGGTVAVEAALLGRRCIGTDISSLANFISVVKTTPLRFQEVLALKRWISGIAERLTLRSVSAIDEEWKKYTHNLGTPSVWRLRKLTELAIGRVSKLQTRNSQRFARAVILRTAQWAVESAKQLPTADEFRASLAEKGEAMLSALCELGETMQQKQYSRPICLHRSVIGLELDSRVTRHGAPKLILTSPPYPGVHVLYHRWQVNGRKETPAPFWIANVLDGSGASYYTFGGRTNLNSYYHNSKLAFKSIAAICDASSVIVQLVAFAEPSWQLPKYLEVLREAGLVEIAEKQRVWRKVPNRRWYAEQKQDLGSAKEVLLIHRKAV